MADTNPPRSWRIALEHAARHLSSDWPQRCQDTVRLAREALNEARAPEAESGSAFADLPVALRAHSGVKKLHAEACSLQAEIERLRAELRRVQDYIDDSPDLFEAMGPIDHWPNTEGQRPA